MDIDMAAKRKPASPKKKLPVKTVYIHKCSQKEVLEQMSIILVGNGHPEDGLAFRFGEFMTDHKRVLENIEEIKLNVSTAIKASITAAHAIEEYKRHEEDISEGKEAIIKLAEKSTKEKREKIRTTLQLMATIIGIMMFILAYMNIIKQSTTNGKKIDNLGTPVLMNPRGAVEPLQKGEVLKMYPKDFTGTDTTNKVNGTQK
jgi:predicted SnoaL-like aldol condensation-catalyzing enzyme